MRDKIRCDKDSNFQSLKILCFWTFEKKEGMWYVLWNAKRRDDGYRWIMAKFSVPNCEESEFEVYKYVDE